MVENWLLLIFFFFILLIIYLYWLEYDGIIFIDWKVLNV